MQYKISGTTMQTVEIDLAAGESVFSQTHAMAWMTDAVTMDTNMKGGFFSSLKRSFAGASLFMTKFAADRASGQVTFAAKVPGNILVAELAAGESLICRRESFLCAESSVTLDIAFQRTFGAAVFSGEGFILQRVTGPGTVWLDLSGEIVEKTLTPGERLRVHAAHLAAQEPSVQVDIQMVRGFRNILFGGEGLFLATVTGPGKVWLQSMPILNLAEEIGRYLPDKSGTPTGASASGAIIGGVIGSLLD